jgi:hypothetical protein
MATAANLYAAPANTRRHAPSTIDPAQTCVDTINSFREGLNLAPLARWRGGEACAARAAAGDSGAGEAHGAFRRCGEMAQNECPDWPGPPGRMIAGCLRMMWEEGPGTDMADHGHYINMTRNRYTEVACGFHTLPNGKVWSVQNFR